MRTTLGTLVLLALSSGCVIDGHIGITPPTLSTGGDTIITFTKSLDPSATVTIQNANGAVDLTESADNLVHVTVTEQLNGSPPVRIEADGSSGGLIVCSLYEEGTRCADGSRSNGSRAVVTYVVSVPPGLHVVLVTGNGAITILTTGAPVIATTGNGAIDATIRGTTTGGGMTLTSGNGSIRVTLPSDYSARIDATTGNGTVRSELPVRIDGTFDGRHLEGTLGNGGSLIRLTTGNGTLEFKKG